MGKCASLVRISFGIFTAKSNKKPGKLYQSKLLSQKSPAPNSGLFEGIYVSLTWLQNALLL